MECKAIYPVFIKVVKMIQNKQVFLMIPQEVLFDFEFILPK